MKCYGIHFATRQALEITFSDRIEEADNVSAPIGDAPFLAPGWIDLQVNGFAGVDYSSPSAPPGEIARSICALHATGVTRFFPTVITGPHEAMAAALRNLAAAREREPGCEAIEGIHVEGPYISPEDGPRGAHPREWVRPPDLDEFLRFQDAARGAIKLLTVAPEWPQAPGFIERLVAGGVVVSIGHTNANASEIAAAVSAGATVSTHLGNAAHELLPRRSNYIWEQLAEDRLFAGFIVDGIHLDNAFLKTALRAKGVERSFLVTDVVAPAGCAPGRYRLGSIEVDLAADGSVRLPGQSRLAGSTLCMDRGIANLMSLAGLSLEEAVSMATINPARAGGISGRQNGLVPGDRADIVQFRFGPASGELRIEKTFAGGREVFSRIDS